MAMALREKMEHRFPRSLCPEEVERTPEKHLPPPGKSFLKKEIPNHIMRIFRLIQSVLLIEILCLCLWHSFLAWPQSIRFVEIFPWTFRKKGEEVFERIWGKRLPRNVRRMNGHETKHGIRRIIPCPCMKLLVALHIHPRKILLLMRSPSRTGDIMMPILFGNRTHKDKNTVHMIGFAITC